MSQHELIIEGARQNNLKNLFLRLPHNKVIAITGVSGSGKSSLAFDTIFAEGQWRFIESLSTYARLFIEKLDRPDVDAIRNIRPAIALEQKNPVKGSRSTVGTMTEIYDLLRIVYSKVSTPCCPKCGREIRKWDPSSVVAELLEQHQSKRIAIAFETAEGRESLMQRGFHRLWLDGLFLDISEPVAISMPLTVVVDRLVVLDEPRFADSIETAWKEGKAQLKILVFGEEGFPKVLSFSGQNRCDECGITLPEPSPIMFSFNHPVCACSECKGFGNVLVYDEDLLVPDKALSLSEGAINIWEKPGYIWWKEQMLKGAKKSALDMSKPFGELSKEEKTLLYEGGEGFYGINDFFEDMEAKRYKLHVRVLLSRYRSPETCPKCKGARLCEDALSYRLEGFNIYDVSTMPLSRLLDWLDNLQLSPMQREIAKDALNQVKGKLKFLKRVGLDYLTLSRQSKTLSGGEYQRVNLSNQLASALTGTIYVLDEPTIGLHPRDTRRIAEIMRELASPGNTLIVVEHDKDIIASSDWVVEMGPGGGHLGGDIVFAGAVEEFKEAETLTSNYVYHNDCGAAMSSAKVFGAAQFSDYIELSGASGHNLKKLNFRIPLKALTVVTGVSGSGKSSLVVETLYRALARHFKTDSGHPLEHSRIDGIRKISGVRLIDQGPIGKTPRSNPLTYLKMFEPIRKLLASQPEAKAHGYTPGFFSFNVPGGRCESCKGEGWQRMEMYFFEDIFVRCEDCKGRRYIDDALRVTYNGKNISDIFDLTVDEAYEFFAAHDDISLKFRLMRDIGLGYLRLGQPAPTLSGGEAQRLKICAELSGSGASKARKSGSGKSLLYILDEPTIGLHGRDVALLVTILRKLVSSGNAVLIIEHNLDVVAQADWVIDLGPEGGEKGGTILFQGTPDALYDDEVSYTAEHLRMSLQR
ncbi:MAG: excinuclease ABC subunit UvrA [Nitrospirae bacterium]|nr:excinuclease ABC subunit UvrA [Nitrospirota bacterium]